MTVAELLLTGTTSQASSFHSRHQRAEWDMKFQWEKSRSTVELLWEKTVKWEWELSEGMSRLARLVLLQSGGGCMYERIHLRIEILCQRGYPFVCAWRGWQIPGSMFLSKGGLSTRGQRSLPYQTFKALTLEGNRGVRQIKHPYPVAAVCACVLW